MEWLIKTAQAADGVIEQVGLRSIDLYTWLWCVGIAALGGFASFWKNIRAEKTRPFNIAELVGEIGISAFVGVMTMLACSASGINELWTGVLCGITGHMGSRALMIGENMLTAWAQARAARGNNAES